MARVATPGGVVAVVVPGSLQAQPAYGPFVDLAARHAGPEAVTLLGTYWACGDLGDLTASVEHAGLRVTATTTRLGTATFGSVDEVVATDVESTPLVERISDEVYSRIRQGARDVLRPFVAADGTARIPLQGHIVAAHKPGG